MECDHHNRLNAFHDGELSADFAAEMNRHLATCRACSEQLIEIRALARAFEDFGEDRSAAHVIARGHMAAETFSFGNDVAILRIAGFLTALAASVFVIASVWLREGRDRPAPADPIRVTAAPEWERVAMTLDIESIPAEAYPAGSRPALADARLADWMLENLTK